MRYLKWYLIVVVFLALLSAGVYHAISSMFDTPQWTAGRIEESKAVGDRIVVALSSYYKAYGCYPTKLEELVPAYIPAIGVPTAGSAEWHYVVRSGSFELSFAANSARYPKYT